MLTKIKTPGLEKIVSLFKEKGFEIRLVGGVVRDFLMGHEPKDVDLCTDATPTEMMSIKGPGIKILPTGLEHGTVTFYINGEEFEITTLRVDVNTDGRHADVEFVRNFKEDAARRDLTINAMSMDFNGTLYDYFGGQEDLKNGVVRFVGDADKRIKEDYLRILRYFRFVARFSKLSFEELRNRPEIKAIENNRLGLDQISGERIWSEMSKLLSAENSATSLKAMRSSGVMRVIGLPFSIQRYDFINQSFDKLLNLSLFINCAGELEFVRDRYKISNNEFKTLEFLYNQGISFLTSNVFKIDDFLDMMVDGANRADVVRLAIYQDFIAGGNLTKSVNNMVIPVFPVTGQDLINKGYTPGKQMGEELRRLKDIWKKSRYSLSSNEILDHLR